MAQVACKRSRITGGSVVITHGMTRMHGAMMLRNLIKANFAAGIHQLGIDKIIGATRGLKNVPLVVCYHRVVADFEEAASHSIAPMLVSLATFERQLDWIGKYYDFVSVDQLAAIEEEGNFSSRRRPVAAVTFDDGYADVNENAMPVLTRKGIPSAVFVVTDLVGTPGWQLHDELYFLLSNIYRKCSPRTSTTALVDVLQLNQAEDVRSQNALRDTRDPFEATRTLLETCSQAGLRRVVERLRGYVEVPAGVAEAFRSVSWEDLGAMVRQGVTVGSHTRSHSLLEYESSATMTDEVSGSKRILEDRLGVPIKHFAYPDGRFNRDAVEAVAAARFRSAFTICMHRDNNHPILTIPRRVLWENTCMDSSGHFSPAILSCQVNGIFDLASKCQRAHGTTV